MELKHEQVGDLLGYGSLLIVPYGIETKNNVNCYYYLGKLLIVPYGIETL